MNKQFLITLGVIALVAFGAIYLSNNNATARKLVGAKAA